MESINNTVGYQNHRYYRIEDIDDLKHLIGPKSPLWRILESHKANVQTFEASNVTSPNSTLLTDYGPTSAATYIIVVILVYGLSMAFIIGSLITKRKEEHTAEKDIRQWVHINSVQDQLKRQIAKQAVKKVLHRQNSEVNTNNIPRIEEEVSLLVDSTSSRSSQSAPDSSNVGADSKSRNAFTRLPSLDSSLGTYDLSYATEDFKKEIFSGLVSNGTNSTLSDLDTSTNNCSNGTTINDTSDNVNVNTSERAQAQSLQRSNSFNNAVNFGSNTFIV
ncbi:unnamed protein product [Owenia fusiformis]|uniref:Uncharacterized protein n=1 Tax=Owenia fusiformis TaxID=6347 RepID=A0A8J1TNR8_OWEFU|nr:unnamed protein product [Owenia fusiformis]